MLMVWWPAPRKGPRGGPCMGLYGPQPDEGPPRTWGGPCGGQRRPLIPALRGPLARRCWPGPPPLLLPGPPLLLPGMARTASRLTSPSFTRRWGFTPSARNRGLVSRGRRLMPPATRAAWMGRLALSLPLPSASPLDSSLVLSMLSPLESYVLFESSEKSLSSCPTSSSSRPSALLSSSLLLTRFSSISSPVSASRSSSLPLSEFSPAKTSGGEPPSPPFRSLRGASPCTTRRRGGRASRATVFSSLSAVMDGTPWYSRRLRAASLYRALEVPGWRFCAGVLGTASARRLLLSWLLQFIVL